MRILFFEMKYTYMYHSIRCIFYIAYAYRSNYMYEHVFGSTLRHLGLPTGPETAGNGHSFCADGLTPQHIKEPMPYLYDTCSKTVTASKRPCPSAGQS